MRIVDELGSMALAVVSYLIDIATLIGYGVLRMSFSRKRGVIRDVALRQILFTGVEAVPFVGLLAGLSALMLVVEGQVQLGQLGQSDLFCYLLVVVLVRELGPLLIAMVVIARSGSAMAAEIANMRVSGEIQTLELSGIDPFLYLVVPRQVGVCVSLVCLVLLFVAMSLVGGFALNLLMVEGAPGLDQFTTLLARQLSPSDPLILLAKTIIPGLLITAIACAEGMSGPSLVTEVPRATTRAVVRSITGVFLWDALVTAMAYL